MLMCYIASGVRFIKLLITCSLVKAELLNKAAFASDESVSS